MTTHRTRGLFATFSAAWLLAAVVRADAPYIAQSATPYNGQNPGIAPGVQPGSAPTQGTGYVPPSSSEVRTPSVPVPSTTAPALAPLPRPSEMPASSSVNDLPPLPRRPDLPPIPTPESAAEAALKATSQDDVAANFEPYPGGLTSEQVVRQALVTSPDMKKVRVQATRAEANKQRSNLAFAPRIDLTARYTHLSHVKMGSFAFPDISAASANLTTGAIEGVRVVSAPINQVNNQYYTQAGLTLPVTDFFLTVAPLHKSAKLMAEVAADQERAKALQVAYDARVAFYNYCHVKGGVVVAEASVKLNEANVRDLEALVQAGTATETDLIRARGAKAQAEQLLIQFQGGVNVALTRLSQLMGQEVKDLPNVGERLLVDMPSEFPEPAALTAQALKDRPEVTALRTTERVRHHMIDAKKGAQYPRLNGFLNGYYANPNLRVFPQTEKWTPTYDVGASLTWSPNDAVLAYTQVNDAESDLIELQSDLRAIEDGIGMEAANAVASLRTAVSGVESATQTLTASRRYFDDKRALMLAGATTPNDVLSAQTALTRDALSWLDAYVNVRVAQAAVLKVEGKTGLATDAPQDTRKTR